MAETHFDEWIAQRYETLWPELFEPAVIDSTVTFLAELAGAGPALELGVGTGRIALPLSRRGVEVHGIELSPAMVAELQRQRGNSDVAVTIGDFATTAVGADRVLPSLLEARRRTQDLLLAPPLRLAVRAGPHGALGGNGAA